MLTLEKLKKKVEPHIGDLVLTGWDVARLLGVIDDGLDWAYVMKIPHQGIVHMSVSFGFSPLKNQLDSKIYHNLNVLFYMNEPHWKDYDAVRDKIPEKFKKYR